MSGIGFDTHIALKREEHDRLLTLGRTLEATLGARLSPRQVVLYMLKREERRRKRKPEGVQS